jgi:hypothetical protein
VSVVALRRARGWTIVNGDGGAISLTTTEAQNLRRLLGNELDASKSYTAATPAKARWH